MKTIICGGRNNHITDEDKIYLNHLKETLPITHVVSGGAVGVDMEALLWAVENDLEYTIEFAKWDDISYPDAIIKTRKDGTEYDVRAGFRRNEKMSEMADACVALKGGTGTKHMFNTAKKKGLLIFSNYFMDEEDGT